MEFSRLHPYATDNMRTGTTPDAEVWAKRWLDTDSGGAMVDISSADAAFAPCDSDVQSGTVTRVMRTTPVEQGIGSTREDDLFYAEIIADRGIADADIRKIDCLSMTDEQRKAIMRHFRAQIVEGSERETAPREKATVWVMVTLALKDTFIDSGPAVTGAL